MRIATTASWRGSAATPAAAGVLDRRRRRCHRGCHHGRRRSAAGATRLAGLTLPGLANAHSHAFHRALRGRTQTGPDRSGRGASRCTRSRRGLTPSATTRWPGPCSARWCWPAITCVGEFHYLHHDGGGGAVRRPERDGRGAGRRRRRGRPADHAARHVLPARRHRGRARGRAAAVQRRRRRRLGRAGLGARRAGRPAPRASAPRSTRCGPSTRRPMAVGGGLGRRAGGAAALPTCPSSRPRTSSASRPTASRPIGAARPQRRARRPVHRRARHPRHRRRRRSASGPARCVGVPVPDDRARPRRRHRPAPGGSPTPVPGSPSARDSHAVIDLFEEARAVELDERLRRAAPWPPRRRRAAPAPPPPTATPARLAGGRVGWRSAPLADLVTVGLESVRLAGDRADQLLESVVFAATAADVHHVVVGGDVIVADGAHVAHRRRRRARARAVEAAMNDGTLVRRPHRPARHQRRRLGDGPLGVRPTPRVVVRRRPRSSPSAPAGRRRRPSASTPTGDASSPASSTATPTWCSPVTGRRVRGAHGRPALRGRWHRT